MAIQESVSMLCIRGNNYQQIKCSSKTGEENYDVYTITAEPLPSHMRSLLPASEKHMETYVSIMTHRNRLKYILLTILVFVISMAVLTVLLIIGFKQTQNEPPTQRKHILKPKINHTIITDITSHVSLQHDRHKEEIYPAYVTRTPCVNECWAYAAFRFKSECNSGFCKCKGDYYDPLTCLPHVDDCNIMVNSPSVATASLRGKEQKTFTCKTSVKAPSSEVHVLSIFGNHRSMLTRVRVSGLSSKPRVLILVNYHPITWELTVNSSKQLQQIVLVSFNHLSKTNILFRDSAKKPQIKRLFSLTGYGQDRFGGHTPELLRNLVNEFGTIASFTGTSHADNWEVNFKSGTSDSEDNIAT